VATIPANPTKEYCGSTTNLPSSLGHRQERVVFHPQQLHIVEGVNYRKQYSKDCPDFRILKKNLENGWLEGKILFDLLNKFY